MKRTTTYSFSSNHRLAAIAAAVMVAVTVAGIAVAPSTALAVPINYGDFSGTTVMYLDVTEDTNTGDTQPLFGEPNLSDDSLDFDPVGFSANSSGGGAPDLTDGQLSFMIMAHPGQAIKRVSFREAGDTTLSRALDSTDDALTSVTSDIFIDILEVNGDGINPISVVGEMTFTPSDGDYQLSIDGTGFLYNTSWTGEYELDLNSVAGVNGLVTKVSVNLDNTLTASSAANSSAFIAKKDFKGVTISTNIPEPTTALLALSGGLLAMASARRRG